MAAIPAIQPFACSSPVNSSCRLRPTDILCKSLQNTRVRHSSQCFAISLGSSGKRSTFCKYPSRENRRQYENHVSQNAFLWRFSSTFSAHIGPKSRTRALSPTTAELAFSPRNDTESSSSSTVSGGQLLNESPAATSAANHGNLTSTPLGLSSVPPGSVRFDQGSGMLTFSQKHLDSRREDDPAEIAETEFSEQNSPVSKPTVSKPELGVVSPGPGLISFKSGLGFVEFSASKSQSTKKVSVVESIANGFGKLKEAQKDMVWLCGPLALAVATIAPPAILLPLFASLMGSTKQSELLALIGTDISFVATVCFFLYWTHTRGLHLNTPISKAPWEAPWRQGPLPGGYTEWRNVLWFLGVCFPLGVTLLSSQFYVGTLAAAVLLPPVIMFLFQAFFEKLAVSYQSPVAPLIALVFDGYRLHQLNRAAAIIASAFKSLQPLANSPESQQVLMAASCLHWVYVSVQILGALWLFNASINLCCLPWLFSSWRPEEKTVPA